MVALRTIGPERAARAQRIGFCTGADGVRLAYAVHGEGPPLLIVSCWLSHLEHDWESPVWHHFLEGLGRFATVARYDERGFGLSDWSVDDFSLEARVADLEAIVASLRFERFALLGMSGGAPVAMAYAARHPDRVTRFIGYGAIAAGCFGTTDDDAAEEAFLALVRAGWARPEATFRRVFSSLFIPDATEEQMGWLDELQRQSTSTDNAIASRTARRQVDVSGELPRIGCPSLVLHARGDRCVDFESGVQLASRIPGSRLVPLDSRNHILLEGEPAWGIFLDEVRAFLEADRMHAGVSVAPGIRSLSSRERDVLELAAEGSSNDEIARTLGLSVRTIERHLSNAYLKLGVSGKAARAAAVAALLRQAWSA